MYLLSSSGLLEVMYADAATLSFTYAEVRRKRFTKPPEYYRGAMLLHISSHVAIKKVASLPDSYFSKKRLGLLLSVLFSSWACLLASNRGPESGGRSGMLNPRERGRAKAPWSSRAPPMLEAKRTQPEKLND